jgi:hypothetical protein
MQAITLKENMKIKVAKWGKPKKYLKKKKKNYSMDVIDYLRKKKKKDSKMVNNTKTK